MTDFAALLAGVSVKQAENWWRSAVVYQVYPRSFADTNGDGIGDLGGVIEHLDYLQQLGVDAIWLSPIYESPGDDNGYDISNYQSIDPTFGTFDDFDRLLVETHARGMKLIMDLVVNHTSDKHPWFVESASSVHSAKRDWYWWRAPREEHEAGTPGAEPTNWESFFSGPTWQFDPASREYYLHLFSPKQPDLNWENPEVRAAVHTMMNWWLDKGVDGFRMDVINLISKNPDLADGPVAENKTYGDGFANYSYGPRLHEFLQEMHREVFDGRTSYVTVGEMPGATVEQAQLFTDPARAELNMVFQFEHVGLDHGLGGKFDPRPLNLRDLKKSFTRWQDGLADHGWNSLYWNNHDQPRAVSRFGAGGQFWQTSATALAAILHLQRGTPYIYQGEEIGMTNAPFRDIDELRDIESLNYYAQAVESGIPAETALSNIRRMGRDNARTPMQWNSDAHGGFTTGTPWIAANPNFGLINVQTQTGADGSILEFYRQLIHLRHALPIVSVGSFEMLAIEHSSLFAFERKLNDDRLLVVANLASNGTEFNLSDLCRPESDTPFAPSSEIILCNHAEPDRRTRRLRPWEVIVYRPTRS